MRACHNILEATSMSELGYGNRRSQSFGIHQTIESRLMFGACFVLFLFRAIVTRMLPWRRPAFSGRGGHHETIFSEANTAASVCVASSFMGL
jgi:hypothetical protein